MEEEFKLAQSPTNSADSCGRDDSIIVDLNVMPLGPAKLYSADSNGRGNMIDVTPLSPPKLGKFDDKFEVTLSSVGKIN